MHLPTRCLTSDSHLEFSGAVASCEGAVSVDLCLRVHNGSHTGRELAWWRGLKTLLVEVRRKGCFMVDMVSKSCPSQGFLWH